MRRLLPPTKRVALGGENRLDQAAFEIPLDER